MVSMTLPQYRRHECTINGRTVKFWWPMWSEVLALLLVSPPDRFISKSTLIEAVWPDPDFEPEYAARMIITTIHYLRSNGVEIETHYSFGWRIPEHARGQMIEMRRAA